MNAYKDTTTYCSDEQYEIFLQKYDDLLAIGANILESNRKVFGFDELRKMVNGFMFAKNLNHFSTLFFLI